MNNAIELVSKNTNKSPDELWALISEKPYEKLKKTIRKKNTSSSKSNNKKNTSSNKAKNKENEMKNLNNLKHLINNNIGIGIEIKKNYKNLFKKSIQNIEIKATNKDHYDLLVNHTDGTTNKVEAKSTKKLCNLNYLKNPWDISVQALNLFGSDLPKDIYNNYIIYLYEFVYKNIDFKKYNIEDVLPSLEEFTNDILNITLKTKFMKKLKENLKNIYGSNQYGSKFKEEYKDLYCEVNNKIIDLCNNKIKTQLCEIIQKKLDTSFQDKDAWLSISGDLNSNLCTFKWWSNINTPIIKSVKLSSQKNNYNLYLTYILDDDSEIQTYIRLRNGINNLSYDFK